MGASRWVELENCNVLRETDKAFLVDYGGEEYWLPRSQVEDGDDYHEGAGPVRLVVTRWICEQKEIEVPDDD